MYEWFCKRQLIRKDSPLAKTALPVHDYPNLNDWKVRMDDSGNRPETEAFNIIPFGVAASKKVEMPVMFNRLELGQIFSIYARMVGAGEWKDYALDSLGDCAIFSVFRRASECPLYRIEKHPKLVRKQGAFCVVNANGFILKRGHELAQVLHVFDKSLRLVTD